MDPLFLFWLVVLGLPITLLLARPWWGPRLRRMVVVNAREQRRSALLARKEEILAALRELEVDFRGGKLPEEDYKAQREMLLEEGAEVLRELEALEAESRPEVVGKSEAELAPEPKTAPIAEAEDPIEALLQARRAAMATRFIGFCPQCGAALRASHRFCPLCGAEVPADLRRKARKRPHRSRA